MKWITHEVVTGVIVFAATNDALLSVYSMAGAIIPDKIEGSPQSIGWSSWRSRHRGWSHWPMLYLLLALFLYKMEQYTYLATPLGDLRTIGVFLCIGAILHILEDGICGKVPFILPWQKVGVKLFKVGSFREYLAGMVLVFLAYGIRTALDVVWK